MRNMKHQRKQRYNGQLSFIDPFINNPKTPNVKKEERLEQAEESMEQIYDMPPHMDNPEHDVIYAVEAEDLESQEHDPENVEDCEYELMEKQMVANEEYYEEEEEPDEQEIYLTNNESFKCTKIEAQSDCSGPIIKRIKTDITDYSEISGQNLSGDIDWDFYRSIAKSITKLTPLAQAQIKGKIFQLVNEADIVHFTKQQ